MSGIDEIKSFARDFVNGTGRTAERKALIRTVYRQHFKESLRVNCITCYIEAILKLLRIVEHKECSYKLKKGVILQPFGKGIITNDNLTDEIAEECLRTKSANPGMFAVMPEKPVELEIVAPKDEDLEIIPQDVNDDIAQSEPIPSQPVENTAPADVQTSEDKADEDDDKGLPSKKPNSGQFKKQSGKK